MAGVLGGAYTTALGEVMKMSNKVAFGVAAAAVGALTIGVMPAQAATITTSSCSGKDENFPLTEFVNPDGPMLPLRCGTTKYGFNHIVYRKHFNSTTLAMIQTTLTNGQPKDAGAKVLFGSQCEVLYTVAFGYNGYNGVGPAPVGIITAYPPDTTARVAPGGASSASAASIAAPAIAASYRKDCPIYFPIGD